MGFTRRAVVNLIQIGREYCILPKIRIHPILAEKNEDNVYVNQDESLADLQI